MRDSRANFARRGFTLPELILGLLITSLIASALASLAYAVSQQWQSADGSQSIGLISRQAMLRLESTLRSAKYVGYVAADASKTQNGKTAMTGAGVIFWAGDANADGQMQLSEIAMIEHDGFNSSLVIWTAPNPNPNGVCFATDIDSAADVTNFKKVASSKVMIPDVTGAVFTVQNSGSASQKPAIEYTLTFTKSGQQTVRYGMVTLRSPTTTPVAQ